MGSESGAKVTGALVALKKVRPPLATRLTCQAASETLTVGDVFVSV